jgi:branched-chain amino acid transport system ATP-binding protein
MSLLRLEHLTRRFGGLTAVDNVSLTVEPGGVTAIIGPNGAGKTTLFNLISGAIAPTEGRVFLDDREITGKPPEQIAALGLVRTFQLVQLFRDLTVLENVKVGTHLHTRGGLISALFRTAGARREEQKVEERALELLEFVGLASHAETRAAVLPYGQQRLLEIARALAARPRLLALDEPAAGLNTEESRGLSAMIRRVADQGIKVLLIEHDMNLVMNTADQIAVLDFGRHIATGTPDEIRKDPAVLRAYLGEKEASHA